MCANGDPQYVVPLLKAEIQRGIKYDVDVGFTVTFDSIIDASGNDDFQPTPSLYNAFPHFNSYDSFAAELKGGRLY